MMTNLFTTFDPCTGMLSMNWMSSMIIITMFNFKFWMNKNNMFNLMSMITKKMKAEINTIMPYKNSSVMFISMMLFILINNLMGLLPYIFTSSSHLLFSLSLALPMWTSFMIYGWMKKTNYMLMHMVPMGTPSVLMPFMVMIETISMIIRPGSLAVRLTANMIAGHLIMSLIGSSCSMVTTTMLIMVFILLMTFETAVSMIQSYVFTILMTLYSSEV